MQLFIEKFNGLGNDFLLIDQRTGGIDPNLPLSARIALTDRYHGVGADGLITLLASEQPEAVVRMHITNSDGSIPEMCGNGLRCVSRWLLAQGLVRHDEPHSIETDAGLKTVRFVGELISAEMGVADFDQVVPTAPIVQECFEVGDVQYLGTAVSMGNPHLVLEAEPDPLLAQRVGPILECHAAFPNRTNVGFLSVVNPQEINLAVWERGAGYTKACGTGACAAAAVAVKTNRCPFDTWIQVNLPGGALFIRVEQSDFTVHMKGPAQEIWKGTIDVPDLPL